jgi:gamma-glutamyltranspeptidase
MDPSEARRRLLNQHDHLRALIAGALQLAELRSKGSPVTDELSARLDELRRVFAAHNELETSLLEPMLRSGDAWAPARVARMLEEHAAEHAVFSTFFHGSIDSMATGLAEFAEEVDAHMAAEERTFLSPRVLRDDLVTDGGPSS